MKSKINLIQICLLVEVLFLAATGQAQLTVTQIAAGTSHSLFLESDGSLWVMGNNESGQLGDGLQNNIVTPVQIAPSGFTEIAGGDNHSLFLKSDGSLWAAGTNGAGQLGDGTINPDIVYLEEIVTSGVLAISAGGNHSLFIKRHGNLSHPVTELWAMGDNQSGELGNGTTNNTNQAALIESYTFPGLIGTAPVTAIAAGNNHSLFLKSDGSLWGMGGNAHGELGDGTTTSRNVPEQIVASGVTAIAAGYAHSLFLKSDGSLWAMGHNFEGQLGNGTYNDSNVPEQIVASGVTAIAAGFFHSLFVKSDGSLWAMGDDEAGQLGDGIGNLGPQGGPNQPEKIVASGVTAIAAGGYHSLFIRDGSLWAIGDNSFGELGDGTTDQSNYYVDVPELIVAGPTPAAGIGTYGNQPVVFFPTTGINYVLQMTTNLASPNWVTVSNAIPFSGYQLTNAPGTAFFRLQTP